MTLVAITTVASFESVGSILVIAMLIVPGATAHLLTDRLHTMIMVSVVIGSLSAILGSYCSDYASFNLGILGYEYSWDDGDDLSGVLFFHRPCCSLLGMGFFQKLFHQIILGIRITL